MTSRHYIPPVDCRCECEAWPVDCRCECEACS